MKLRFIEHLGNIYIVVGMGHAFSELYFEALPIQDHNLVRSALNCQHTLIIPFSEAIEITDKNRLTALMVLYGQ